MTWQRENFKSWWKGERDWQKQQEKVKTDEKEAIQKVSVWEKLNMGEKKIQRWRESDDAGEKR